MSYTPEQMRAVVAKAREIAGAAAADPKLKSIGVFDLLRGGRCQEFVRECFESALGLAPGTWKYAKASAKDALAAMDADGYRVTSAPKPGDVIGHRNGDFGHIAIMVDAKTCAENTSSAHRGTPRRAGTKLTPLAEMKYSHVIRFAEAPAPSQVVPTAPKTVKLVELITGRELGELTQEAAALLAEGKLTVAPNGDHRKDQGKLYISRR